MQSINSSGATNSSLNFDLNYTYNNEGHATSVTYPSTSAGPGPTYNYSFDSMSRLSGLTGPNSSTIVSNVSYGPANELKTINYLSGSFTYSETRTYNSLLQLTNVTSACCGNPVVNMQYNYTAGSNNGKISSQTDGTTGETVQYTYDSLNRLITAQSGSSWGETYTFDGFGNLTQKTATGTAPPLSVGIDPTTNRIVSSSYDANGNMLSASGVSLTYDSENRVIQAGASPGITYGYDAQNERIFSCNGGVDGCSRITGYQIFMYSPSGQKIATYQITSTCGNFSSALTTSDTYFGSRRIAPMDRLSSAGKYYPYGEDKGTVQNDTWNFATYWRDSATGLDYAMNRYYSNSLGRFTSPDPYNASGGPANPQSWNRYAYVGNDPTNLVDPEGLEGDTPDSGCLVNGTWDPWCGAGPGRLLPQTAFTTAVRRLLAAQNLLSDREAFSTKCYQDIASIQAQRSPELRADDASINAIIDAATGANFVNGVGSTDPESMLYTNPIAAAAAQRIADKNFGPGQTIGNDFARNPNGLTAESVSGGQTIYINPSLISNSVFYDAALLFHEAFHLLGFDDADLLRGLGIKFDPNKPIKNTKVITDRLSKDCFQGKDNH